MTLVCPLHVDPTTKNKRPALGVCHHCGRPLCAVIDLHEPLFAPADRQAVLCGFIIQDPEFLRQEEWYSPAEQAYHCENCLTTYHRNHRIRLLRLKSLYA